DQQRDQQPGEELHRRRRADHDESYAEQDAGHHIGRERQPQPAPQQPERRQHECRKMESVAHEHETFRSACCFALARRRLVHGECGHRTFLRNVLFLIPPLPGGGRRKVHPPSEPLVDGTSSLARGSIATAARSARARPLKQDSAIWWSFVPYSVSACSVMPEFIAKAWNHSFTSSVSNEPTLSRTNSALNTRNGRPEMSSATRVNASSIGTCTSAQRVMPFMLPSPWRTA